MFTNLMASNARRFGWLRNPWVILISVAAHAGLFAGLLWGATDPGDAGQEPEEPEQVTYVDVSEIPPPPEPEVESPEPEPPAQQEPAPQEPAPAPRQPRDQPEVTEPDEPAGFQELQTPDDLAGIPEPDPSTEAVEAEDFGGRGTPGGVAGGEPPEQPAGAGAEGEGAGGGGGEGTGGGTFTANLVDRAAEPTNAAEVIRSLQRRYPSHLRDAGIGGRVVVQFVVTPQGRVDPGSIRVLSTSNPAFENPTVEAIKELRFRPARKGDQNVRMLTQMPIQWQPKN